MTASIAYNPYTTTNALGSFNIQSTGFVQGMMLDDPAIRNSLAGGVLSTTETIPMWGGVGIYELIAGNATSGYLGSPSGPGSPLGGQVGRATAASGGKALTGWSVFNQAHGMINDPTNPVPLSASGMQVNFFRLGSGARIAVKADAALAAYAGVDLITQSVAWDYVNQLLIPVSGSISVTTGNTYNSTTGVVTLNLASSPGIDPGDSVTVASLTGTGSSNAIGTFTAIAGTTGTVLKYEIATSLSVTISDSSGTITTGPALVGPKLLEVNTSGSMVVDWDGTHATWDRSGTTAIILI